MKHPLRLFQMVLAFWENFALALKAVAQGTMQNHGLRKKSKFVSRGTSFVEGLHLYWKIHAGWRVLKKKQKNYVKQMF